LHDNKLIQHSYVYFVGTSSVNDTAGETFLANFRITGYDTGSDTGLASL